MKLSLAAHRHIEEFYREYLGDENLKLPPIAIYSGRVAEFLTRIGRVGAITLGRRMFVRKTRIASDEKNRPLMPRRLLAHEAMHAIQYQRVGFIRFFISYLREFWRELRRIGKWNAEARMSAYLAMRQEREARAAEEAYEIWLETRKMKENKLSITQKAVS
jgi:hypothetical protein